MPTTIKITEIFGRDLAELLATKIQLALAEMEKADGTQRDFQSQAFITAVDERTEGKTYTQRIAVIAETLHEYLPADYAQAVSILMRILGPENPNQTGMFTYWYWLMPVAKFVELYGIDDFDLSMQAIEAITKRSTGEYAVRPYIRRYPDESLARMRSWATSDNFHLRRLASEGLRPKLPWAPKLEVFNHDPAPVFAILELLKADDIMFVKKSVANHLTDWLKVNPEPTRLLLADWKRSDDPNTQWIIKHATRKIS